MNGTESLSFRHVRRSPYHWGGRQGRVTGHAGWSFRAQPQKAVWRKSLLLQWQQNVQIIEDSLKDDDAACPLPTRVACS